MRFSWYSVLSHERAKLVLFYNPSATKMQRVVPPQSLNLFFSLFLALSLAKGIYFGVGSLVIHRKKRGWSDRLSTSVLKVCDSLQIDSLSSLFKSTVNQPWLLFFHLTLFCHTINILLKHV